MTIALPRTHLQIRSLVTADGELRLSLAEEPMPTIGPGDVLVRMEAAPINPSDQGLLLGPAGIDSAIFAGTPERPMVTARVPVAAMAGLASRINCAMPVGNEGAGVVVAAGSSPAAQALRGRTVALFGGGMYAQYRAMPADQCLPLPEGVTPAQAASSFVNPITALGMVETMQREGHTALVHTAAASNLGQMLVRLCRKDGIPLVSIVRRPEQAAWLRSEGAEQVCVSSSPTFLESLAEAVAVTGATMAFDATGGGELAGQILACMEAAINRKASGYSAYGSTVHKQVYLYGNLDPAPTTFKRSFGTAWAIGGWLVFPYMEKIGPEALGRLKARIAAEVTTTFASHYSKEVSLVEALSSSAIAAYTRRATGTKYLINPAKVSSAS